MANFMAAAVLMLVASVQLAQSASPSSGSPYKMTYKSKTKVSKGTKYCYELRAFKQPNENSCSNFDVRKIELDLSLDCRGAATDLTYNGQKLAGSYQEFPAPGLVFKVIRPGGKTLSTQASLIRKKVAVCFTLPSSGKCSSLGKFCRDGKTCQIAFFGPDMKCYSM